MNEKVLHCLYYFHLVHTCPWMVVQATFTGLVCTSMVNYQVPGYVDLLIANVML